MQQMKVCGLIIAALLLWACPQQADALEIFAEVNAPSVVQDKTGRLSGYYYDYIREMVDTAGIKSSVRGLPWKRAYMTTLDKPGTALFPTARTQEREDLFQWVGPISVTWWQLFKQRYDPLVINNIDQAKLVGGIGVVRGSAREAWLKARNFPNIVSVTDHARMHVMFAGKRLRLIASSTNGVRAHLKKMNLPLDSVTPVLEYRTCFLYLAMHKDTPQELVSTLQKTLDRMKAAGRLQAIHSQYHELLHASYKRQADVTSDLANNGKRCE